MQNMQQDTSNPSHPKLPQFYILLLTSDPDSGDEFLGPCYFDDQSVALSENKQTLEDYQKTLEEKFPACKYEIKQVTISY